MGDGGWRRWQGTGSLAAPPRVRSGEWAGSREGWWGAESARTRLGQIRGRRSGRLAKCQRAHLWAVALGGEGEMGPLSAERDDFRCLLQFFFLKLLEMYVPRVHILKNQQKIYLYYTKYIPDKPTLILSKMF